MLLKTASLPDELLAIIRDKGTEPPHSGQYNTIAKTGTFLCRQCGLALYRGVNQFHSSCGWPSFDASLDDHIAQQTDADGRRTEILCQRCQAHLGHVFHGEGFTAKNVRHCVNSASLDFVADEDITDSEEAIVAGGCFWGVEHALQQADGVVKTEVGYCGGEVKYPTYQQVCAGHTGHVEAVRVVYDPTKTDYQKLIQYFFTLHDPEQQDGQGPDIGSQYLSTIFYYSDAQQQVAQAEIDKLSQQGKNIATQLKEASVFWPAEDYHQNYWRKRHR